MQANQEEMAQADGQVPDYRDMEGVDEEIEGAADGAGAQEMRALNEEEIQVVTLAPMKEYVLLVKGLAEWQYKSPSHASEATMEANE